MHDHVARMNSWPPYELNFHSLYIQMISISFKQFVTAQYNDRLMTKPQFICQIGFSHKHINPRISDNSQKIISQKLAAKEDGALEVS